MSSRLSRFSIVAMSSNHRDWRSSMIAYSPAGRSPPAHCRTPGTAAPHLVDERPPPDGVLERLVQRHDRAPVHHAVPRRQLGERVAPRPAPRPASSPPRAPASTPAIRRTAARLLMSFCSRSMSSSADAARRGEHLVQPHRAERRRPVARDQDAGATIDFVVRRGDVARLGIEDARQQRRARAVGPDRPRTAATPAPCHRRAIAPAGGRSARSRCCRRRRRRRCSGTACRRCRRRRRTCPSPGRGSASRSSTRCRRRGRPSAGVGRHLRGRRLADTGRHPGGRRLPVQAGSREDGAAAPSPRRRRARGSNAREPGCPPASPWQAAIRRPTGSACAPTSSRSSERSWTSAPEFVKPQAMRRLWPITTNGTPGIVTPMTSRPAATRCISYQTDGNSTSRCGSLASSGRPLAVRLPAITQLLLLPRLAIGCSHSRPAGQSRRRVAARPDRARLLPCGPRRRQRDGATRRRRRAGGCGAAPGLGASPSTVGASAGIVRASCRAASAPSFCATAARTSSDWWFSASRHASSRPTASVSTGVHGAGVMPSTCISIGRWRGPRAAATAFTPAAYRSSAAFTSGRARCHSASAAARRFNVRNRLSIGRVASPEDLGEPAGGDPPIQLHLPEPLAGVQDPGREPRIIRVAARRRGARA